MLFRQSNRRRFYYNIKVKGDIVEKKMKNAIDFMFETLYNEKEDNDNLTDSEKNRMQVETDENTTNVERQQIQSLQEKIAELQMELSKMKETNNEEENKEKGEDK